ncbi:TonB-dependent receptor domain-containing protein [Prevotella sp.]|uniref:TonB-dependent receptor domain-containing protein n=1 Tax=Prevotella sp. TaxID=59823 RepID=UPI003DA4F91D
MKKLFLLAMITLLFSGSMMAQKTTISGTLKDSIQNATEPYATIRVYKPGNLQKPIAMSLTDGDGKIKQVVDGKGTFVITFNSVGKKLVKREFTINGEPTVDLGNVYTFDDSKALKGVEIVAQKPVVKMETDKMTYNVQEDVDSKSMTLLDMMRKVPMVTVDGQDNITVNGSKSFKILVDGKENPMFQANASQIFKSIPASMVKNIEVVTNPGAKYDAEGTAGILNIKFNHDSGQKQNMDGYSGNVSATVGNKSDRMSAYIGGQQGKLTYSANATVGYQDMKDIDVNLEQTKIVNGQNSVMKYNQKSDQKVPFEMGNLNLGYEIDSLSTINAGIGLTSFESKINGTPFTTMEGGIYGSGHSYSNKMSTKESSVGFNGNIDYQRFFDSEHKSSITLSYLFSNTPSKEKSTRNQYEPKQETGDMYSDMETNGRTHTLQVDLVNALSKNTTLNTGVKYIYRHNKSDSKYYDYKGDEQVLNADNSVKYNNDQSILAGYAEYVATMNKFSTKAGLRYEHTWENIKYPEQTGKNFKKDYGCLVPSFTLSYAMTPMSNLGVNYSMHILRPGISYLNPYVDRSDPTFISYGNPKLDVEKSHYVSLVYNMYSAKFMMNMTLGQNFCNNQIAEYSFVDKDNVLNTTRRNNTKNRWTNFNMFARWTISKTSSLMMNGSVDYGDMRSKELNCSNNGWQGNIYASLEQVLPLNIKWSLGLFAKTRDYNIQGYSGGMQFLNTSFTKQLFKDRLSLSVQYVNPMRSKLKITSYSAGADFINRSQYSIPLHMISFTAAWKFGNSNKQYGQHKSNITNDFDEKDKKGAGSGMGGVGQGVGM